MDKQLEVLLAVPLKLMAASYTLTMAADSAVKTVDDRWSPKAHRLCRVIGLDGLIASLGCVGLSLAFLICAFGLTTGFRTSAKRVPGTHRPITLSDTALTGLSVFAGSAIAGTCTFFLFDMLVTLELKGFVLTGFLLAAVLLTEYKQQRYNRRVGSARMLVLFSVTFTTMLFAVQCSYNVSNPATICIFPSLALLGFSADRIGFKKPRGSIILSLILVVPLTGVVLGFSVNEYYIKYPLLSETANTLNSAVYKTVLLTGLVGALAGTLVGYFWMKQEDNGLSLWICGPAAVVLYNLDVDSKHLSLHSLLKDFLGPSGELGLITSFAAASGLSFGLAFEYAYIISALEIILMFVLLGLLFHYLVTPINLSIMAAMVVCIGVLNTVELNDRRVPLQEAAWDFSILAKVTMGAAILGLAGLLTSALGAPGFWGVFLGLGVALWKAYLVSGEDDGQK